jgi:hypothetical protein
MIAPGINRQLTLQEPLGVIESRLDRTSQREVGSIVPEQERKPARLQIVSGNPTTELLRETELLKQLEQLKRESDRLVAEHRRVVDQYRSLERELEKFRVCSTLIV